MLSSCVIAPLTTSPSTTQVTQSPTFVINTISTVTPLIPLPTSTVITIEENKLDFELPPDCSNFDPSINPVYYADLSNGACNYPALSPDGTYIAYASFKVFESGEVAQEARLYSVTDSQSFPIYKSQCGILLPEWTPSGFLVFSDTPQDVGCGYTVIFDTAKNEIVTIVEGAVRKSWRDYWSPDKTSFFTLGPEKFGPTCSETLSGYDLISLNYVPTIMPITSTANIYVVIGDPIWNIENENLFAVVRDGICSNEENYECTYSNSYIISIDFASETPTFTYPYYDPSVDYSIIELPDGKLEIVSTPTNPVNCKDVISEESK